MTNTDDFYSPGISDIRLIDRFIYRGRGRPRKTDYTTFSSLQIKVNVLLFWYLFIVKYGSKIYA